MKNLYYNIYDYIDTNHSFKQESNRDIDIDLNDGFKVIYKDKIDNEKFKPAFRFNVSNRATHKNS